MPTAHDGKPIIYRQCHDCGERLIFEPDGKAQLSLQQIYFLGGSEDIGVPVYLKRIEDGSVYSEGREISRRQSEELFESSGLASGERNRCDRCQSQHLEKHGLFLSYKP